MVLVLYIKKYLIMKVRRHLCILFFVVLAIIRDRFLFSCFMCLKPV